MTTSNSYETISAYASTTFADAAIDEMYNQGNWSTLTSAQKERYLKASTALIDTLSFVGYQTDTTQANQFPRMGEITYPYEISIACVICARDMGLGTLSMTPSLDVSKEQIGDASWTYNTAQSSVGAVNFPCQEALLYLADWLKDPRTLRIERSN